MHILRVAVRVGGVNRFRIVGRAYRPDAELAA